jgi:ribose transport system ATP-binding protein
MSDPRERDPPATPVLAMRGITKRFFGVPVLREVDLDAFGGEVHARWRKWRR